MEYVYILKEDLNRWVGKYYPNKDLVSVDDLLTTIETLDEELTKLKEEFEEFKQNVEENYKQIPYGEEI